MHVLCNVMCFASTMNSISEHMGKSTIPCISDVQVDMNEWILVWSWPGLVKIIRNVLQRNDIAMSKKA